MESMRDRVAQLLVQYGGNVRRTARELEITPKAVRYHRNHLQADGIINIKPLAGGRVEDTSARKIEPPPAGKRRLILTCAQNNTRVNEKVWASLLQLSDHYGADLWVATFAYNKGAYGQHAVKRETYSPNDEDLWYADEVRPHIMDERVEIAPGLVWCGEMNIQPTAASPLSGLDNYTRRKSGIFPHVKVALQSVPSLANESAKMNYTTGTVTLRNYIQKKAGQKAEFHHVYGALLVEVNSDGHWWCRQLIADRDGCIQDLDVRVDGDRLKTGCRVEAITWGDFHSAHLDPTVRQLGWGGVDGPSMGPMLHPNMLDTLRPKEQHVHDLLDFYARNHHDRKDPHRMFRRHIEGKDRVEAEVEEAARVLSELERPWCQTVVVDSNHDQAMSRWLRETDYREDPLNAVFFLRAQLAQYEAIAAGDDRFHLLEWAARRYGAPERVRFLREDESHVICGDIECGMHGHLGPNGGKGSPRSLARMGRRANTGHTHSAAIFEGLYVAGTSSKLRLGYTAGPGSWSHSHVVTYPNGKRAIVTMYGGKWRA